MSSLYNKLFFCGAVLFLTGCLYGDLNKDSIDHFGDAAKLYCNSENMRACNDYSNCYKTIYSSYPTKFLGNNLLMSFALQQKDNIDDYTNLMDNIHTQMINAEKENKSNLSIQYSYMLYAHNQCALIMAGRKYDISKYEPYIKEEIRKKFESNH